MDIGRIDTKAVNGMGPDSSIYEYCYEHGISNRAELLNHATVHDALLLSHIRSLESTLDGRVSVVSAIRKAAVRLEHEAEPEEPCDGEA